MTVTDFDAFVAANQPARDAAVAAGQSDFDLTAAAKQYDDAARNELESAIEQANPST
jgi:hypothetical protein